MPAGPIARRLALAALLAAACGRAPEVGEPPPVVLPPSAAPKIEIESVAVAAADRKVVVTYRLTDRGVPITGVTATALAPNWTLAWLSVEPVSGLPAWQSRLLTGSQTATDLPPGGPGTPDALRLSNVRQPGAETSGTTVELGDGRFTYTFANALPAPAPPGLPDLRAETLRVGVFLRGATGTADTNATHDFIAASPTATPASWSLVEDANCNRCHGAVVAHGRRIGVKLCVTCHTWQCTDPDTIDPAAIAPATKAEYPNPMEMGRLIHRIHRGKKLPTLFKASDWDKANRTWPPVNPDYAATPWPAAPFTAAPPAPFRFGAAANPPADTDVKFSVVGYQSSEIVFGRVATRVENFQPAMRLAEGIGYPQDLRNCDACHAGAPQASAIGRGATTGVAISRRTCSGCHPDVFYGDPNDLSVVAPDATHLAHTGGRQDDDGACADCHVVARTGGPKLYAPIAEIHRPLNDRVPSGSPRWSRVTGEIVSVQDMKPGLAPTITFRLRDRIGDVSPLNTTATEPPSPTSSPVPRGLRPTFLLAGPTTDYLNGNVSLRVSPPVDLAGTGTAPATFTFTAGTALPATASGIWAIGMEGRRSTTPTLYDAGTDTFAWPFTGEGVTEWLSNDVKFVDLATGALTSSTGAARRTVTDPARCEACHLELSLHGGNRHDVPHCLLCHTPDATDWDKRPRDTRTVADGGVVGTGMVLLHDPVDPAASTKSWGFATLDGIEERSIHMKTMVHRIHVGEREGAASLEGIRPFVIYGYRSIATAKPNPYFFDDVRFPGELANCELCHLPDAWTIEAIPATAQPTTANERGTIAHTGTSAAPATAAHKSTEPKQLPVTATCLSCHTSGAAVDHAASKTSGGVEACGDCHGEGGAESVRKHHAVP